MKPQNQVTVRSSETDDVFRINRTVAERNLDTLTILDDLDTEDADQVQSVDEPADPIAALVADDN